ncbi:DUF58 domain-containing protein [Halovivax gelatinilyticus]|uniref:DUF58 domain-containing protein n=1 Tax=Halovivax gelatinilyticus TaxID=2961597 RepID=UPI0020CA53C8|nr:DUF58 domain-containing protein [Halovivax gelatinilyticus]
MRPTRRGLTGYALAAVLAGYAVVLAEPIALAGAILVGAWILTVQYRFLQQVSAVSHSLTVAQRPAQRSVRTGARTPVTLSATADGPLPPLSIDVEGRLPTAAVADDALSLSVDPDEPAASESIDVEWPIAGRHRFDRPVLSLSDGFFTQSLPTGERSTLTVEPRGPRAVHVGAGGDKLASTFGEHASGRRGSGIEAAELREYRPGDRLRQIDWKATARLASPHVREYETETDRRTLLVVDHRRSLATGPPAETKLDYLRDVALSIAASARRLGDPTGLTTVGDDGFRTVPSASTPDVYARIRRTLLELEPSTEPVNAARPSPDRSTPTDRRRAVASLDGDSAFDRRLRPFYADRAPVAERVGEEPLFEAVRRTLAREPGDAWLVVFTDDDARDELRETLTYARRRGATVLVVLAPTVLYEPGGLASIDRANERYAAFERYRRDIGRLEGVTALEAGPADRLSAILAGTAGVSIDGRSRPSHQTGAQNRGDSA